MSLLYFKPKIDSVSITYHQYNLKTRTGYYDLSIGIKNIPSNWDYDKTVFDALKQITVEDIKDWVKNRDFKVRKRLGNK